jgi:tryptophanyl-tRNA synthetase
VRTADARAGRLALWSGEVIPPRSIQRVQGTMRILSGIQPSGALHIGNYFGALRQFIDLQRENDAYYFVANYHALTSVRDAGLLKAYTFDVIVTMLALGLDPEKATLFVQSDVPETAELAWLLSTVTPMGWLEKCVSYKDKVEQGLSAEHGLFAYPVLQAADILLYDADLVPVGQDQKQHLEVTRDIAERFNRVHGGGQDVFRLPKPYILESVSVVPGLDGRKMSKSYNNTIDIFDEPATIRKKARKIVTDSTPVEAPKNPETCHLFNLFKLFAAADELAEVERRYRAGGIGYGEVKTRLAEAMIARFAPARERRAEWLAHPERVAEVRAAAAARARATARVVLDRARAACGVA